MALILENGSGVVGANSFVLTTYVDAYLTDRGRATENGWTVGGGTDEVAACIAGTDYVENSIRERLKGLKEFGDISTARATWTPTAIPLNTETVTLGATVYRFVAVLALANDVLIAATLSESISNIVDAINLNDSTSGMAFHADTALNVEASAVNFIDDSLVALSKAPGTAGNAAVSTTTVTGATWNFATLAGGSDIVRAQPLSFPRRDLYDNDGNPVIGIPERLKMATAEYSVRARGATLAPDPTVDALGGTVTALREKVGPIETATEYLPGSTNSGKLPSYPAADRLLTEYLKTRGGAIR